MSSQSVLFEEVRGSAVAARSGARTPITQPPLVARLEIARELAGALDHATGAGQAHIMRRVVQLLRGAMLLPERHATPIHRASTTTMLDALEREAGRMAPDLASFRQRAIYLISLLVRD